MNVSDRPSRQSELGLSKAEGAGSANRQGSQGFALITALLVMGSVMLLGLGMLFLSNSNLMIAENVVGNAIARSNAEAGVDATIAALETEFRRTGNLPIDVTAAPSTILPGRTLDYSLAAGSPAWSGNRVVLRVLGTGPRNAEYIAEALVEFSGAPSGGWSPFSGAVIACKSIQHTAGGRIDSFDSRIALYTAAGARTNASVRTIEPGANIVLSGGTGLFGDVYSTGGVTLTGGVGVAGSIFASADVSVSGGAGSYTPYQIRGEIRTTGNVTAGSSGNIGGGISANGNVDFTSTPTVNGDVAAGGNIDFKNTATVNGSAMAGGTVKITNGNKTRTYVQGSTTSGAGPVSNLPVPPEECDPLNIDSVVAGLTAADSSPAAKVESPFVTITPGGVTTKAHPSAQVVAASVNVTSTALFNQTVSMIKTGPFKVGYGGLTVQGGHTVLYVNGDFAIEGKLTIEPGSSLTVVVNGGKVTSGWGINMSNVSPIGANGAPTFSIFSNYASKKDDDYGVVLNGDGNLNLSLYAPKTAVHVSAGGEMYGALRARNIKVSGAAKIHYDEALGALDIGEPPPSGQEARVTVISRR